MNRTQAMNQFMGCNSLSTKVFNKDMMLPYRVSIKRYGVKRCVANIVYHGHASHRVFITPKQVLGFIKRHFAR